MCTPENLRDNCSCPYVTRLLLRRTAATVAAVVVIVGLWWVVASGYAWALAVGAWLVVMAGAAQVSVQRRRRAQLVEARAARAVPRPEPVLFSDHLGQLAESEPLPWWERARVGERT